MVGKGNNGARVHPMLNTHSSSPLPLGYRFTLVVTLADRDGEFYETTTVMAGDIGQARKMAREFAEAQATEHHCHYRDYCVEGDYEF